MSKYKIKDNHPHHITVYTGPAHKPILYAPFYYRPGHDALLEAKKKTYRLNNKGAR